MKPYRNVSHTPTLSVLIIILLIIIRLFVLKFYKINQRKQVKKLKHMYGV